MEIKPYYKISQDICLSVYTRKYFLESQDPINLPSATMYVVDRKSDQDDFTVESEFFSFTCIADKDNLYYDNNVNCVNGLWYIYCDTSSTFTYIPNTGNVNKSSVLSCFHLEHI